MSLNRFLTQTCTISSVARVNNNWTQEATQTPVYTDIGCFLYQEKRTQQINSISTEEQVWDITLIVEPDKTNIEKNYRVVVTDPELWNLGEYIVAVVEKHRSFTWIWGISIILKKLEDGEN